jgi:TPR repeat protein
MKRTVLTLVLLLTTSLAMGDNDIWQNLFKEKLQEAKQGNSSAQYDVASMYQNGRGVSPDLGKATEWYKKSAAQDNVKAVNRLKLLEANEERFKKVLAQAEKGNSDSQYKLGKMYSEGIGVSIDNAKAAKAFESAAMQGHAKAEYNLGLRYYEGTGVKRNRATAYKWFKAAAEQNDPAAQYYLGKMFATGSGVRQNYATSLEWLTKSVDGGFNQARGEMIDVSERMKMSKTKKKKPASAETVVAKKTRPVAKTSKPKTEKARVNTAKNDNKGEVEKTASVQEFAIEDLMVAAWSRDTKPVTYLPSSINNCRTEESNIVCYSDNQTRESGSNKVSFKTKSIMQDFSRAGSFTVTYRNLVINSTPIAGTEVSEDDGEVGDDDDSASSPYQVKTGWGKEHTLECQLIDTGTVSCLKNKTHTFLLVSPHTLAGK